MRCWCTLVLRHSGAGHLPIAVVIYTSFLQTSGPVFSGGFGLNSYARVIREVPDVITNTFKFSLLATLMITLVGGLVSYIIVRRETALSGLLDSVLMVPYVVPGVVMAIGFLLTFNSGVFDLVGTASIIVLILFIRRLPYGVRATSAVLRQIKPSIEEAAISLGASPAEGVSQGHRAIDVARCGGRCHDEFYHRHQRAVVNAAALHRWHHHHAGQGVQRGARW
jgi:ABC-type Fe3+ transport system permease subunit